MFGNTAFEGNTVFTCFQNVTMFLLQMCGIRFASQFSQCCVCVVLFSAVCLITVEEEENREKDFYIEKKLK